MGLAWRICGLGWAKDDNNTLGNGAGLDFSLMQWGKYFGSFRAWSCGAVSKTRMYIFHVWPSVLVGLVLRLYEVVD